jgi:SAM-dependent methyltransferase
MRYESGGCNSRFTMYICAVAHSEQMHFFTRAVSEFRELFESDYGVIDFGSFDNGGGGPHTLFSNPHYVGIDLELGNNVTFDVPSQFVDLPSRSFAVAMSSECFEHNPFWRETFMQMCRLTRDDGLVLWSCAGIGRREHGTTRSDGGLSAPFVVNQGLEYYKNVSAGEAKNVLALNYWFTKWSFFENYVSRDTYFIGLRKGASPSDCAKFDELTQIINRETPSSKFRIRSKVASLGSERALSFYFSGLKILFRMKRFKEEKGKLRKIIKMLLRNTSKIFK